MINKNIYSETTIERTVMRRVRLIRILGLIISTATLAILTGVAALWGIGREVWVARVFENMPQISDAGTFMSFWLSAFLGTQLIVQALIVLTCISLLFLLVETVRFLVSYFIPARA